jgi:uncharacterized protein with von Willebrand factor type A (vWA) domain
VPERRQAFTRNWLAFTSVLRRLGFDAGPVRSLAFLRALTLLDLEMEGDVRAAVRAHFARRKEDGPLLDRALSSFLGQATAARSGRDPGEEDAAADTLFEEWPTTAGRQLSVLDPDDAAADEAEDLPTASFSPAERLRHKDFDAMSDAELAEIRRLIRAMRIPAGLRRSRRFRRGGDERLDMRRLLRNSLRFGGEPLQFTFRRPRLRPRPLVLICDISGSMERYTRVLLDFAYAIENASERVEAFVFATRLTRITRMLRSHDAEVALDRVTDAVEDWSGGTRIGEAIATFNRRFGRRVLGHGATVVLISDGWDRGDPGELRDAVVRLQRSCHRLLWMNPLMGDPAYEPLTTGLRAALPYVDDFLPCHNLSSLEALGRLLLQAHDRRPVRRQAAMSASA